MKKSLVLASALALVLVSGVSNAKIRKFKATMTGAKEVPANASNATGSATVDFDDVTRDVTGTITFLNLHLANDNVTTNSTNCHIHTGGPTVAGGVIVTISGNNTQSPIPLAGEKIPTGEVANFLAGNTYVNVHSGKYGGGEIRGQLVEEIADAGVDAAADAADAAGSSGTSGASGTSGTSGASGSSGTSGRPPGSSSGATTNPSDDAGAPAESGGGGDGGCSTTGTESTGTGLAMAGLAIAGLAIAARARKKR